VTPSDHARIPIEVIALARAAISVAGDVGACWGRTSSGTPAATTATAPSAISDNFTITAARSPRSRRTATPPDLQRLLVAHDELSRGIQAQDDAEHDRAVRGRRVRGQRRAARGQQMGVNTAIIEL
jgi:hypothetical protein